MQLQDFWFVDLILKKKKTDNKPCNLPENLTKIVI